MKRAIYSCTLLATMLFSSLPSRAADKIVVTLYQKFLETTLRNAFDGSDAVGSSLYWRNSDPVQVSRVEANRMKASLDMAGSYKGITADVDIDLYIGFGCFWGAPAIDAGVYDIAISVDLPWWVDIGTLGLAHLFFNGILEKNTLSIITLINSEIDAVVGTQLRLPFQYCPHFNASTSNDLQILFGAGTSCTNGQTSHSACSGSMHGTGIDKRCINGYWEIINYDCELNDSSGGLPK